MRRKLQRLIFKIKLFFFLSLVLFIIGFVIFIILFEKQFMPTATIFSEQYATNVISNEINDSVQEVIKNIDLSSVSFFKNYSNDASGTNYLDVNNMLINEICSKISANLTNRLNVIKDKVIRLPLGSLSGVSLLSNIGPSIRLTVSSIGSATVGYETKFESVGINQLNFQVWLQINTQIVIINGIYSKEIDIKRSLMLVNVVFNGDVPNTYFNIDEWD